MGNMDSNGDNLQSAAPVPDEAVDRGVFVREDVCTSTLFRPIAECFLSWNQL